MNPRSPPQQVSHPGGSPHSPGGASPFSRQPHPYSHGSPQSPGGASSFSYHQPHPYSPGYNQNVTLSKADASDWQRTTARIDTFVANESQDESQIPSAGKYCVLGLI